MQKIIMMLVIILGITACSDSDLVATFDSGEISKNEFNYYLDNKGIQNKTAANLKPLLESYARREALTAQIVDTETIDLKKIQQQVKDYQHQLILNQYFDRFIADNVTPDAVKNYYATNPEKFEKEKAKVAHILFRIRSGMSDAEIEALKTRAYATHAKLIANHDFDVIAKTESDDKVTAPKGGVLGWIKRGAIDPNFSQATFAMKKDQISEPVRSVFGFHIIKVLEAPQTVKIKFEDVKGEIHHSLRAKAKQAEIERLLNDANIVIMEDKLANE